MKYEVILDKGVTIAGTRHAHGSVVDSDKLVDDSKVSADTVGLDAAAAKIAKDKAIHAAHAKADADLKELLKGGQSLIAYEPPKAAKAEKEG